MLDFPFAADLPACVSNQDTLGRIVFNLFHNKTVACSSQVLIGKPLAILLILVVAGILRRLSVRVIRRVVDRSEAGRAAQVGHLIGRAGRRRGEPEDPLIIARRKQRAETIGSVLRSAVALLIVFIATVEILAVIGINLGPIIASAGIVGVALGFGAQNLVKDFLAGVFILLEDQYGVGDVVDLSQGGKATGTVEEVGLRVTRLRSVDGAVWYVRNGEMLAVGNMSQGWSRALLDVGVAYGSDLDLAMRVIKDAADSVWRDPTYAADILEEPEMWGVQELAADQVTLRLVLKTVPLTQWVIGRELRLRIKTALDAAGIEIPFPQRTMWVRTEGQTPGTGDPNRLQAPGTSAG